jgi:hypothetical protein
MEHEHQSEIGKIVHDVKRNERLKVIDVRYCEKRHCTMLKLQYQRFKFDMLEIAYPVWKKNIERNKYTIIKNND